MYMYVYMINESMRLIEYGHVNEDFLSLDLVSLPSTAN